MARLCWTMGMVEKIQEPYIKNDAKKDDTLNLGRAVAKILRRHGVIVDETRTKDITVSLKERSNFEKKGRYDYFSILHRNAFKTRES